MSDSGRNLLVSKFVCAECGELLDIYSGPLKTSPPYASGEPTGASMKVNAIALHPCAKCLRPVQEVVRAVTTLLQIANKPQ